MAGRRQMPDDLVHEVVRSTLGGSARVLDVHRVREDATTVLVLTTSALSRRVVLKAVHRDAATGIDLARTAAAMELARTAGAPVPEVLGADSSYRSGSWQHLVQVEAPGSEWRRVRPQLDVDELAEAHCEIAHGVLALQSATLGAFGELDEHAQPAGVPLIASLRVRAGLRVRTEPDLVLFQDLLDREADLFADAPGEATLCHDDLHHDNVLFVRRDGRWKLSAFLDWDKAWSGPPDSDVARMALWDGMTGPGFWEVYRAAVPERPGEARRRLIHQLLWCLGYDDGTARHAADTKRVLADLGLSR